MSPLITNVEKKTFRRSLIIVLRLNQNEKDIVPECKEYKTVYKGRGKDFKVYWFLI
jgi:hypothetical protein